MAAAGSAIHEDVTAQRLHERVLLRTERFLATVIENTSEGIIAKDARNLRYVFVNNAAEETIGKPRGEIVGKTARQLFAEEIGSLIEQRDRQLIGRKQQLDPIVDTINNPAKGVYMVAVRRLQIGGPDDESPSVRQHDQRPRPSCHGVRLARPAWSRRCE